MLRFPVRGKTLAQLQQLSQPQAVAGGTSEAIVWAYHDTETYVSTTTTTLSFFTNTKANRQLSNLSPAGSLPSPQYFEIYGFHVDFLIPGVITALFDSQQLLFGSGAVGTGAPTFQFTYADKQYGPWALSLLHGTGGTYGFASTTVAATTEEFANNSQPDGGFFQDGAIVLAPNQSFQADIVWPVPLTLTASKDIRVTMSGVLHRRVL